jgi:hypothetical protein
LSGAYWNYTVERREQLAAFEEEVNSWWDKKRRSSVLRHQRASCPGIANSVPDNVLISWIRQTYAVHSAISCYVNANDVTYAEKKLYLGEHKRAIASSTASRFALSHTFIAPIKVMVAPILIHSREILSAIESKTPAISWGLMGKSHINVAFDVAECPRIVTLEAPATLEKFMLGPHKLLHHTCFAALSSALVEGTSLGMLSPTRLRYDSLDAEGPIVELRGTPLSCAPYFCGDFGAKWAPWGCIGVSEKPNEIALRQFKLPVFIESAMSHQMDNVPLLMNLSVKPNSYITNLETKLPQQMLNCFGGESIFRMIMLPMSDTSERKWNVAGRVRRKQV